MIAGDGEGARHRITVDVCTARDSRSALTVARTVANSPLVKTAVYGTDPNWGRVLAAVGRAGVRCDTRKIDIYIGDVCVCRRGAMHPFSARAVRRIMGARDVVITIDLNQGTARETFWTCDFSEDYIRINADYTT